MFWLAEPTDTTSPQELAQRFLTAGFTRATSTEYPSLRSGFEASLIQALPASEQIDYVFSWGAARTRADRDTQRSGIA